MRGKAAEPTLLVIRDGEVSFEPAGELWGKEIPETFDALKAKFGGKRDVGVSAIGPAGEKQLRIASVMNDRYHAFGRQGFGAIYGSEEPQGDRRRRHRRGAGREARPSSRRSASAITDEYKKDLGLVARFMAYMAQAEELARLDVPADGAAWA